MASKKVKDALRQATEYALLDNTLGWLGGAISVPFVDNTIQNNLSTNKDYARYENTIKRYGLEDYTIEDIVTELHNLGYLSDADYAKAADSFTGMMDAQGSSFNTYLRELQTGKRDMDWGEYAKAVWGDSFFPSGGGVTQILRSAFGEDKEGQELLNKITNNLDKLSTNPNNFYNYLSRISEGGDLAPSASIAGVAAPNYMDTSFANYQREVDPVKLWTGQELADLHNIDYNPDTYYNLIKQGTEAEVARANYEAALMNEASMINDTANVVSYLDGIRNTKAEAISTGATAGAQAAAEVLQNKQAINNYAQNQSAVADARFNAVDNALLADASAKINARQYFNNLANTLGQDILTLYANDTDRFGQDMLSNAEFYTADEALRGQRIRSNADMWAAQATANSAINASRAQADATTNEYAWVFNAMLNKYNGDFNSAKRDFQRYMNSRYTGYTNYMDLYENVANK